MLKNIHLSKWRQFDNIDISFDERLTILTGANGSGKTTILNILAQLFGEPIQFVSNVERHEDGRVHYSCGINKDDGQVNAEIGKVEYNDSIQKITVPSKTDATYYVYLQNHGEIRGLYINSHRSKFLYKKVSTIPTQTLTRNEIYNSYQQYMRKKDSTEYYNPLDEVSTKYIKEALIALATFGYGNTAVKENSESIKIFEGFQDILKKILPKKLGFKKLSIEVPEVILETSTGSFPIDSVSGGIASIIELAWQIYMFANVDEKYTVIIDEPENHLHPELQQSLLVSLLDAFPNAQFIVSSHNPFIISSSEEARIYVLNYNEAGKVYSYQLENINMAGSSNDILRDVLGITNTIPLWADNKIDKLIKEVYKKGITSESLSTFREEMNELGFSNVIPEALVKIFEGEEND